MGHFFGVYLPVILTLLLLVWWHKCCKWDSYEDAKFPTRGHCVLIWLPTFCPILGWIIFVVMVALYLATRINGALYIKYNKFTHKWFEVEED